MRTVESNKQMASYLTSEEYRQLGHLQIEMLAFVRKYASGDIMKRFSIASDSLTRRVASSLEKRGLIEIRDKAYECWTIGLPTK